MASTEATQPVLIVAPEEGDALALEALLREHHILAEICPGAGAVRGRLATAGALLLTEEALQGEQVAALFTQLGRQ
ncbi:MAG: hypothetical protein JO005_07555, partial [Gammaproteobacteria bacterium]|nr:hypothetical protein [Gammaproteobacteria bacterium]